MADEHAVPDEKGGKVHGDKLDGVLEATEAKGAAKAKSTSGGPLSSHLARPEDGEDDGGLDNNPSDGRPMP